MWDTSYDPSLEPAEIPEDPAPASFDWRDHNAVSEVKNQVIQSICFSNVCGMVTRNRYQDCMGTNFLKKNSHLENIPKKRDLSLSIEWNSIRLGGLAPAILTKTVHKTLPGGLGKVGVWT